MTCYKCGSATTPGRVLCHEHTVEEEKAQGFWCVSADRSEVSSSALGFMSLGEAYRFEVRSYRELSPPELPSRLSVPATYVYVPDWVYVLWADFRRVTLESVGTNDANLARLYRRLAACTSDNAGLVETYLLGGWPAAEHLLRAQGL